MSQCFQDPIEKDLYLANVKALTANYPHVPEERRDELAWKTIELYRARLQPVIPQDDDGPTDADMCGKIVHPEINNQPTTTEETSDDPSV
jgi:ABC-type amino acid transport substrate-binding protein